MYIQRNVTYNNLKQDCFSVVCYTFLNNAGHGSQISIRGFSPPIKSYIYKWNLKLNVNGSTSLPWWSLSLNSL